MRKKTVVMCHVGEEACHDLVSCEEEACYDLVSCGEKPVVTQGTVPTQWRTQKKAVPGVTSKMCSHIDLCRK